MADIVRPIEPFELTQGFGENPAAYARFGLKGHNGWDFRTKFPDTPQGYRNIMASWLQKFYRTGNEGNDGFGLFFETVCQLYSTWKLTYAHCKSIESFDIKNEGETMAISDNTGNSTGSHLHLTVKRIKIVNGVHQVQDYNNGYFGAVNPQEYFDEVRKWKTEKGKPEEPKGNLTMTIDDNLYTKLVNGATVRKELAIYLKEQGGNGFDDPDNTQLPAFKSYFQGKQSRITDLENNLNKTSGELEKANVEIVNQKDKVANIQTECQTTLDLEKARYDALKKSMPDMDKLEGVYKGTIEGLQKELRDAQKAGGQKDLEIADLKNQLKSASGNGNVMIDKNLIQSILDFLQGLLKK